MDTPPTPSLFRSYIYLCRYPEIYRPTVFPLQQARIHRQTNDRLCPWLADKRLPAPHRRPPCHALWLYGCLWRDRNRPGSAYWSSLAACGFLWHSIEPGLFPFSHMARLSLFLWSRYRLRLLLAYVAAQWSTQYGFTDSRRISRVKPPILIFSATTEGSCGYTRLHPWNNHPLSRRASRQRRYTVNVYARNATTWKSAAQPPAA